MFFFLSKSLPQLVLPVGLCLFLLLVALWLGWRRRGVLWPVALALPCLLLPSLPLCADLLLRSLEVQHPVQAAARSETADVIVVLGGGTAGRALYQPEVELTASGMRLLYAFRLYRAGKAPYLLLSGGTIYRGDPEAEQMRQILSEWGVPDRAMVLEQRSRNTHENAVETVRLCRERGFRRVLLVTSAFHMPRALGLFRKEGGAALTLIPASTGAYVSGIRPSLLMALIPDAGSLANSSLALRERLGAFIYRMQGWL